MQSPFSEYVFDSFESFDPSGYFSFTDGENDWLMQKPCQKQRHYIILPRTISRTTSVQIKSALKKEKMHMYLKDVGLIMVVRRKPFTVRWAL